MPTVRPFRALRYDQATVGPLDALVAPPYDVISDEARLQYLDRSPYNVVHLTLPESEQEAADDLRAWREEGVLVEAEPGVWWVAQDYVGPDGVARTREGFAASVPVTPYSAGEVLPHERTHAGPKEGRLRLLRATRTQLEPIFLLHDGDPVELPSRGPDLALGGEKLWRLDSVPDLADRQLLIADGHHRYETALAFHEEDGTEATAWMMVVLVSTRDEGLTIYPTHRIAQHVGAVRGTEIERPTNGLPGVVVYSRDGYRLVEGDGLDVELVESLRPEGVAYTPPREEGGAGSARGEAEAALLVRPTPIEAVFERARGGDVLPQKTTYFFPKLTSGLLFYPLD